ncbi:MAG: nucleotidyltransferase family protein, partial [Clostridia bacterium]|nr:nucleotidyltransferase family protein [Clostridia bacterium]
LPIGGRPMMDYLMDGIASIKEMTEVHIVSNHKFASQFEAWKADTEREERYPNLTFRVWDDGTTSNDDRLGAVGDMQFVIERANLDDDVLVAASDNFFTFPLSLFVDEFRKQNRDILLAGQIDDIETLRRFAVAQLDEAGKVLSLQEKPENPLSNTGIYALYIYRKDTLPLVREYLDGGNIADSPGRFPEWLFRQGRELGAYTFEGECVDIGTHESYREICEQYAK